jgi:hypothetical protein
MRFVGESIGLGGVVLGGEAVGVAVEELGPGILFIDGSVVLGLQWLGPRFFYFRVNAAMLIFPEGRTQGGFLARRLIEHLILNIIIIIPRKIPLIRLLSPSLQCIFQPSPYH